jgi:hypothetical protein
MRLPLAALAACALAAGVTAGCSAPVDNAPPVAAPSVTLSRQDVAIGSPLDMTYRFAVAADAPAFADNYWVFVHFLAADGELMWTDDHEPPTPTTAWTPGATIEYTRTMFAPKFPYIGATQIEVGLFSPATGDRLPLSGEVAGQRAYRVASFDMRAPDDAVFIVFRDGWHPTETDQAAGREWQWTQQDALLAFRNPRRDVTFFLDVDQPVASAPEPQQVEIRVGGMTVDAFPLPPGRRELRRVNLTTAQLGEGENVEVTVSVDRTFVPSTVPELRSTDPRALGVRVFRAYVE